MSISSTDNKWFWTLVLECIRATFYGGVTFIVFAILYDQYFMTMQGRPSANEIVSTHRKEVAAIMLSADNIIKNEKFTLKQFDPVICMTSEGGYYVFKWSRVTCKYSEKDGHSAEYSVLYSDNYGSLRIMPLGWLGEDSSGVK